MGVFFIAHCPAQPDHDVECEIVFKEKIDHQRLLAIKSYNRVFYDGVGCVLFLRQVVAYGETSIGLFCINEKDPIKFSYLEKKVKIVEGFMKLVKTKNHLSIIHAPKHFMSDK